MTETHETLGTVVWRLALVLVPAIVVLGVLNALPQFLGGEPLAVVRYDSVEQLQERLRVVVWRPSELPAPWSWPPTRVRLAAGRPGWLQFVFEPAGDADGALVICQTTAAPFLAAASMPRWLLRLEGLPATDRDVPETLLGRGELLQESEISIDNRTASVRRLLLHDGAIVHELWWRQAATRVMLRLGGPADRLTRVANTMLRTRP